MNRRSLAPFPHDKMDGVVMLLTIATSGVTSEYLVDVAVEIPVLDLEQHDFIGGAEVDKLLRHGEGGWLRP